MKNFRYQYNIPSHPHCTLISSEKLRKRSRISEVLKYIIQKIAASCLKLFYLFQAYTEAQIAEGKNTDSVALDVQYAPEPQKVGIYYYNEALLLINYLFL